MRFAGTPGAFRKAIRFHVYLNARLGHIEPPQSLRYAASLRYHDDVLSYHPAMVAIVTDAGGKPVNIHRTYLTRDGRKAGVPQPRKMMPGSLPKGSAIGLAPPAGRLGIAEGIETALAAMKLFQVPC
jgi:putative DNA primase/helicase